MASFLSNLFGGGAEREAAEKNRALYNAYGTAGTGFLDSGLNSSVGAFNSAKGAYSPLSDLASKYSKGTDLYLDALGVNGAAGGQNAWTAFQQYNPGTQGGITAGLDAINRRRAAGGMLDSGNADQDAQVFGQNLQNQNFNNWLQSLAGLNSNALSATGAVSGGLAGLDTGLANLYQQDATNRVGLQGNVTSGNANANALQAQGEAAGARNLLGAGLGVASLFAGGGGLGGLGSAFGGGGSALGSSLGSMGITYGMPGTANSNMYGPVRY